MMYIKSTRVALVLTTTWASDHRGVHRTNLVRHPDQWSGAGPSRSGDPYHMVRWQFYVGTGLVRVRTTVSPVARTNSPVTGP